MRKTATHRGRRTATTSPVYRDPSKMRPRVRRMLAKPTPSWLSVPLPVQAPPTQAQTRRELDELIRLVPQRARQAEFIRQADEDFVGLFLGLCRRLGVRCSREELTRRKNEAAILITKIKWQYNRPRPYQFAKLHRVPFSPLSSKTAATPAYPSGHTIQAFLLADYLGKRFPHHRSSFENLARKISKSRAVGGYHWPSDLRFGKKVADAITKGSAMGSCNHMPVFGAVTNPSCEVCDTSSAVMTLGILAAMYGGAWLWRRR
jgi:hypothetical protein